MTQNLETLPQGWQAHGRHRLPPTIIGGGIQRTAAVHHIQTTANPATTAALVAQIVVSAASGATDTRFLFPSGPRQFDPFPGSWGSWAVSGLFLIHGWQFAAPADVRQACSTDQ